MDELRNIANRVFEKSLFPEIKAEGSKNAYQLVNQAKANRNLPQALDIIEDYFGLKTGFMSKGYNNLNHANKKLSSFFQRNNNDDRFKEALLLDLGTLNLHARESLSTLSTKKYQQTFNILQNIAQQPLTGQYFKLRFAALDIHADLVKFKGHWQTAHKTAIQQKILAGLSNIENPENRQIIASILKGSKTNTANFFISSQYWVNNAYSEFTFRAAQTYYQLYLDERSAVGKDQFFTKAKSLAEITKKIHPTHQGAIDIINDKYRNKTSFQIDTYFSEEQINNQTTYDYRINNPFNYTVEDNYINTSTTRVNQLTLLSFQTPLAPDLNIFSSLGINKVHYQENTTAMENFVANSQLIPGTPKQYFFDTTATEFNLKVGANWSLSKKNLLFNSLTLNNLELSGYLGWHRFLGSISPKDIEASGLKIDRNNLYNNRSTAFIGLNSSFSPKGAEDWLKIDPFMNIAISSTKQQAIKRTLSSEDDKTYTHYTLSEYSAGSFEFNTGIKTTFNYKSLSAYLGLQYRALGNQSLEIDLNKTHLHTYKYLDMPFGFNLTLFDKLNLGIHSSYIVNKGMLQYLTLGFNWETPIRNFTIGGQINWSSSPQTETKQQMANTITDYKLNKPTIGLFGQYKL